MEDKPWNKDTLCACGCGSAFTETLRTGRPKRFINERHARRKAMRDYRLRLKEGARIIGSANPQCRRPRPKTLKEATTAYDHHCEFGNPGNLHCTKAVARTSIRCPAVYYKDYNCEQKLCIAYATLLDDLMEFKMPGRYRRRYTSPDGYWLTDGQKAEALTPLPDRDLAIWDEPHAFKIGPDGPYDGRRFDEKSAAGGSLSI